MSGTLTEQAAAFAAWRRDAREATDIQRAFMAGALAALTSGATREQMMAECIAFGRAIGSAAERAKGVECVKLTACFEGWTLKIDRGIDADDPIALGGSKVDAFTVYPHEGGSIDLTFRVATSDIDEAEAGWLFGHLKQQISITLHAPKQRAAAIDGSTEAFRRDHPGAEPSAEDLFAAGGDEGPQDGDDDPDGQGDDTEGGAPDVEPEAKAAPRRRSKCAAAEVE